MMKLIKIIGMDWRVVTAYKVCSSCGYHGWDDICPNEVLFGECKPRDDSRRVCRGKYRKTPKTQTDLYGRNLREAFWRVKK